MRRTIWTYIILSAISRFGSSITFTTYVIFLMSHGLNLFEVTMVNFTYFTTMFFFEIPTGALADVFGRKKSYVTGCVLRVVGFCAYFFAENFLGFIGAEMTIAIGDTFVNGAFKAWMVDKIHRQGFKGKLEHVFSKNGQVSMTASIFGAMLGAWVANKNLSMPFLMAGGVYALVTIIAIFAVEEKNFKRKRFSLARGTKLMIQKSRKGIKSGMNNKAVRFILLIGIFQVLAFQAPNMFWQPHFSAVLGEKKNLGLFWMGVSISMMIGANLAPWLLKKEPNERRAIIITQVIMGIGIIMAIDTRMLPIAMTFFFVHEAARSLFEPIRDAYLNDNVSAKERATISSFESTPRHLGAMIGLISSGLVAQNVSIPVSWAVSGVILIVSGVFLWRNGTNRKT